MRKGALSFAIALLGPTLYGQTGTASPGFAATREGRNWGAGNFGTFAQARYQIFEGDFRGREFTIKALAFRLASPRYNPLVGRGRSWTDTSIWMAPCNYAGVGAAFARNYARPATRVFSGRVTWPTVSGWPYPAHPTAWGTPGLAFPFVKPWAHTGAHDFLVELAFRGGSLLDNPYRWEAARYPLDGEDSAVGIHVGQTLSIPLIPNSCADRFFRNSPGAVMWGLTTVTTGGTLRFYFGTQDTAPHAPVVYAIGGAGSRKGFNIGSRCNRLHVDFSKPTILLGAQSVYFGYSSFETTTTFGNGWAGLHIWYQAAWADSETGELSLTRAQAHILPGALPPTAVPRRKVSYAKTATAARGLFAPFHDGNYLPFAFYRTR